MFNLALPTTPTSAQPYAVPTERLYAMTTATPAGATMAITGPGSDVAPPLPPPSYAMSEGTAHFGPTHSFNFGFNWVASSSVPVEKSPYTPLSPETPTPVRFAPRLPTDLAALNRDFARRMSEPQHTYNMTSSPLSSPSSVSPLSRRGSWISTGSAAEDKYEPIGALIAPPIALPELPTRLPSPPDVSPRRQRAMNVREDSSPDLDLAPPPKRRKKISKMHPCSWPDCDKSFPRPSALATHMNVHSGEKPWKCPVSTCAKSFAVRSNARRHMRTHGIGPQDSSDIAFVPARTGDRIWRPQSLQLLAPARPYAPALQRTELDSLPNLGLGLSGGWSCLLPPARPGIGEERNSWAYDPSNLGPYHPSQWNGALAGPLPPAVYGAC
ncbi:hypothetical protein PENSPDRAFT_338377 [Peniophora sp. CONT]|nr:hypothetical protein PENSPDRAFT_338377 [Peniophora sp. CONT]